MNSRLKRYAGALAIIAGVLLTWEAASEANMNMYYDMNRTYTYIINRQLSAEESKIA